MCCYCYCANSPLDVSITQSFCSLLFSDGWLQDRSGQWVKDDNVEFDSDEEEPPPLAPPPPGDEED